MSYCVRGGPLEICRQTRIVVDIEASFTLSFHEVNRCKLNLGKTMHTTKISVIVFIDDARAWATGMKRSKVRIDIRKGMSSKI